MIENYEDCNREETLEAVSDFSADRLEEFIDFESEHKDRKTVVEPLKRQRVTVRPTAGQKYVAGVWFDDSSEAKTVRRSTRIENAIEDGDLEVI